MSNPSPGAAAPHARLAVAADALRTTFGFPAAVAMAVGLIAGLGLPAIDRGLDAEVPLFSFSNQDAARSMLETIAMATVSVAGISFSVTVVAFTLAASQLSPRVLRSFRRDLIGQLTLAGFLGTFVYCVAALTRLGTLGEDRVPSISLAAAAVLAFASLALFAVFIGHIVSMLQPSSVIASIAADARAELHHPFPEGVGEPPRRPELARAVAEERIAAEPGTEVRHGGEGFLTVVAGTELVALASEADALIRQRCRVGEYVLPGHLIAELWAPPGADPDLAERVARHFATGRQRSLPQDPGFPVRQLADVALKGLSPGVNDPTSASNAIEAMTAFLIRFARGEHPSPVRLDADGVPRLIADVPELGDLVELGFRQPIAFADPDPAVVALIRDRLETIGAVADAEGMRRDAVDRLLAATDRSG